MNIIEFLKGKTESYFHLKYYGLEDMATSITLGSLVEEIETIKEYTETIDYRIATIDNYIDFIFFSVASRYEETIDKIVPEKKETVCLVIEFLKETKSKYNIGDVVKFIEVNYKEIIDYEDLDETKLHIKYDMREFTIEFAFSHLTPTLKEKNYFDYLLEKDLYFAFDNIDKYIAINDKYLEIILSKENLEKLFRLRSDDIFDYVLQLHISNKSSNKYKNILDDIINNIYNYVDIELNNSDTHIYSKYLIYDKAIRFFEKLDDSRWIILKQKEKDLVKEREDELEKNGIKHSFELSSAEYVKHFMDNEQYDYDSRFYFLTHGINTSKKAYSCFEKINIDFKPNITDTLASIPETDNYYYSSRLFTNDLFLMQGWINLTSWFDKKHNNALWDTIVRIIKAIYDKIEYQYSFDEIEKDVQYLKTSFNKCEAIDASDESGKSFLSFSTVSYILLNIEKLLRNIYRSYNSSCPFSKIQMGALFRDKEHIEKLLGYHTQKAFQYYLSKNENSIGKNLRNKMMHYYDIEIDAFTMNDVLKYLYMYILLCNSLYFNIVLVENK